MAYRILVVGGRGWFDYGNLCSTLDTVLANRLPDVVILTAGGAGVPALAASYARARGLELVALVPDHERFPGCAVDRRDAALGCDADAVVVVGDEIGEDVRRLVARVRKRGGPLFVLGTHEQRPEPVALADLMPRRRGLPD